MQMIEKQIVGQGVDKVGCDAGQDLRQNNALEQGDTYVTLTFTAEIPGDWGITETLSGGATQRPLPPHTPLPLPPPLCCEERGELWPRRQEVRKQQGEGEEQGFSLLCGRQHLQEVQDKLYFPPKN